MQAILEDENEKSYSGRTDSMGFVIYVRRVSRCVEIEYIKRLGNKRN